MHVEANDRLVCNDGTVYVVVAGVLGIDLIGLDPCVGYDMGLMDGQASAFDVTRHGVELADFMIETWQRYKAQVPTNPFFSL